jgi:shikimate dehydrogenase
MKTFGLIGRSLSHSFSKDFFSTKFLLENLPYHYQNFELEQIEDIASVFESSPAGLNVTIPYKESIIPFLDELDEEAREIGAVNTIVFRDGKKIGYNTDAYGFKQSIKPFLTFEHERVLILGNGGASKAVAYVFRKMGIDVLFACRTPQKEKEYSFEEINEHMLRACKCVVNCTPVGTWPKVEEHLPFPFELLSDKHLVIDLIYNPEKTAFLQKAEENGASILNGKGMLQHQALKAWELWNS